MIAVVVTPMIVIERNLHVIAYPKRGSLIINPKLA